MRQIVLVDDDPAVLALLSNILRRDGHDVDEASSESGWPDPSTQRRIDLTITDLRVQDVSGADILRAIRPGTLIVVVTGSDGARDAARAMCAGAPGSVGESVFVVTLLRGADEPTCGVQSAQAPGDDDGRCAAHAAARWASVLVAIVGSPRDLKTISRWARWVATSPGTLRNWCRTAGIPARRSLVFGRLLRAVCRSDGGRHAPENLLDVVDRRTLSGLLRWAGLDGERRFPTNVDEFLERQTLVRDHDVLVEVRYALWRGTGESASGAGMRHARTNIAQLRA